MRIFIIAGESSGDLHAAQLISALQRQEQNVTIEAWAGDHTKDTGVTVRKHIRELAFMGFWEVLSHLPKIAANFRKCKKDIEAFRPDRIIFIDYPGFNMRMAKWAKSQGYTNIYYITPQIWAWKPSRIHSIKKHFDEIITVLPLAYQHYLENGVAAHYVGHPLLDVLKNFNPNPQFIEENQLDDKPIIAFFPGSRKQEIKHCLPVMLTVVPHFPQFQFCIAQLEHIDTAIYHQYLGAMPPQQKVHLIRNQNYDLLSAAHSAIIKSGTASLEACLLGLPHLVCYKTSLLTYLIGKAVIKIPFLSLVNLILKKEVVKELIQYKMNTRDLVEEIIKLSDPSISSAMRLDFDFLREKLGSTGASENAAKIILLSDKP